MDHFHYSAARARFTASSISALGAGSRNRRPCCRYNSATRFGSDRFQISTAGSRPTSVTGGRCAMTWDRTVDFGPFLNFRRTFRAAFSLAACQRIRGPRRRFRSQEKIRKMNGIRLFFLPGCSEFGRFAAWSVLERASTGVKRRDQGETSRRSRAAIGDTRSMATRRALTAGRYRHGRTKAHGNPPEPYNFRLHTACLCLMLGFCGCRQRRRSASIPRFIRPNSITHFERSSCSV